MLRRFVPNLLSAAQRVRTQNSALLERLRRLLDNQTLEENRRLRTLIDTFKRELRDRRNDSLPQRDFWNIEGEPEIVFPVDRPTWKVKTGISIQAHELWRGNISADEAEEELNSIFFINKDNLRANIRDAVGAFEIISLQDLLVLYPIQQGIAELVAYYEIASEEEHHSVLLETADTIYLIRNGDSQQVEISGPRIIFRNM